MPAPGSFARSRLIWTSIALEPSGSVSSAPGVLGDRLAVDDRRRAAHQQLEDQVLSDGQGDGPAVEGHLAARRDRGQAAPVDRLAVDTARAALEARTRARSSPKSKGLTR